MHYGAGFSYVLSSINVSYMVIRIAKVYMLDGINNLTEQVIGYKRAFGLLRTSVLVDNLDDKAYGTNTDDAIADE